MGYALAMSIPSHAGMLQEYYVARVRAIYRAREKRLSAVRTAVDLRELQRRIRMTLARCFGPLPDRTPLPQASSALSPNV